MRRLSLRGRLLLGALGLLAVGLVLSNVAGLAIFRAFQLQQIDQQPTPFDAEPMDRIVARITRSCASDATDRPIQLPSIFTMVVVDSSGQVTCQQPLPDATAQPTLQFDPAQLAAAANSRTTITLESGSDHSTYRVRVIAIPGGYGVLARSLSDVDDAVARLAMIGAGVGAAILAVAMIAGLVIVRVGLRPLTRIQDTAERIAAGDLSQRVPVESPRTEVGRLSTALNAMLAQIEQAFAQRDRTEERLRRFVADASHELRTPLATIRGHAELVRDQVVVAPAEVSQVLGRIESESIRMGSLVDDLLLLARMDTTRVVELKPVDVLSVAVDAVGDTRARAPERRISIRTRTEPPWLDVAPVVLGDDARLHQVATNLLSNAIQHTPSGTAVEVEVGVRAEQVVLAVIDHGPGLRPGSEERVFERFYRADAGRARRQGGAGLGLAIAWNLVAQHGGELTYQPTPGGGSTFLTALPVQG